MAPRGSDAIELPADRPLIFGHRGAAGLLPENTLPSFQRAYELGVDGIELDVHYAHERLWVIHDLRLDRTTSASGTLLDHTPATLADIDAGNGAGIPELAQVLAAAPVGCLINIELKGPETAAPVHALISAQPQHRYLISSFDHQQLFDYRACGGGAAVGVLLNRWQPGALQIAAELDAWSINLGLRIATARRLDRIRAAGRHSLVYTVNSIASARRFAALGVHGLFTDRPDQLCGLFQPWRSSALSSRRKS